MDITIVYEDQHILVVVKPPKIPSQSDKTGDTDMISLLKEYLVSKYSKHQDPYIGIVHRLDRPVGGLMVFAKTKDANAKLSEEIRSKRFQKEYYAVICGRPEKNQDELRHDLVKNQATNLSRVVTKNAKNAKQVKEAVLTYELLGSTETDEYGTLSLVKIQLLTGRHHQIRVQFSHEGFPLWGDTKYNKMFIDKKGWTQIALWAGSISFHHPQNKKVCSFTLQPPEEFPFSLFVT